MNSAFYSFPFLGCFAFGDRHELKVNAITFR